jgi:hypothetical protein
MSKLPVIQPLQLEPEWELRAGVPETRGECRGGQRPCPYVSCRHHLWLRLQEEQPGNPQKGRQGPTTFRPATMESCSLDVAERHAQQGVSFDEIGELLGMDSTRARQIAKGALLKLKTLGVDVDTLLEAVE